MCFHFRPPMFAFEETYSPSKVVVCQDTSAIASEGAKL